MTFRFAEFVSLLKNYSLHKSLTDRRAVFIVILDTDLTRDRHILITKILRTPDMLAGGEDDLGQGNQTNSLEMVRSSLLKVSCLQFLYQSVTV